MNLKYNKTIDILSIVTTIIIFALAMLLVGVRIFGYTPYAVVSGSMSPEISKGSLVYVKSVPFEEIEVGMPITFLLNEDLLVATHRVVDIDTKEKVFTTKGDANQSNDALKVQYANVQGVVKHHLPILGNVSMFVHSIQGITLIVILMAGMLISSVIQTVKEKKRQSKEATQA